MGVFVLTQEKNTGYFRKECHDDRNFKQTFGLSISFSKELNICQENMTIEINSIALRTIIVIIIPETIRLKNMNTDVYSSGEGGTL